MPDNTIEWGQGAVNNTNNWGKAKTNNTIDFAAIYDDSPSGDTDLGGTSTPVGVVNTKSLSFDGVNDRLQVGNVNILSFGDGTNDSAFSLSAWIKTSTTGKGIISKWGSSPSGYEYLIYVVNDIVRVALYDNHPSHSRRRDTTTTVTTGNWIHIGVTYDGRGGNTANQGIKIYINGTEESSYTDGTAGTYVAMHNTSRPVQVGAYNNAANWNGNLEEIALFDYELSSSAITEIYNISGSGRAADMNNLTNATTDPILWYRMGDGDTFPTITDNGTGGNNGAMTNMTSDDIVNSTP